MMMVSLDEELKVWFISRWPSGIWSKHLRQQTGLEKSVFQRLLKKLEGKHLIKAVLSVQVSARRGVVWD